jgi:hypothetical protein
VPGYAPVASASFSGTYSFIGDSCTGHIYLLNADGSVSDVDPVTLVATNHHGISTPVPVSGDSYPVLHSTVTRAMLNPTFGMSTDPVTSQFFMASSVTGGVFDATAYTRVQNFIAIDTLVPFADWGLSDIPGSPPMWVPFEQAMFYMGGPSGTSPIYWYELKYSALSPFCGDGGGGGAIFQPNVCIVC